MKQLNTPICKSNFPENWKIVEEERQKAKEQDIGTKKDVNLDKPDVRPKRKSHDVSL